jgi:hypothetical protein
MPHLPQTIAFNFDEPIAPVPFAPGSHTSWFSALIEARSGRRGRKTRAYLLELAGANHVGLSDPEAAVAISRRLGLGDRGMPVQSICSIRNAVIDALLVEKAGLTAGSWGKPVQRWRLNSAGRAAAEALARP